MIIFLVLYNFSFILVNKFLIFFLCMDFCISISNNLCPNSANCKFPFNIFKYSNLKFVLETFLLELSFLFHCGLIILWVCCIAVVKVWFSFTITPEIPFISLLCWIPFFLVLLFLLLVIYPFVCFLNGYKCLYHTAQTSTTYCCSLSIIFKDLSVLIHGIDLVCFNCHMSYVRMSRSLFFHFQW